ncbi:hypothetical protein V7S43_016802 [Phytophthora oleae]|uniref:Uncharacterized protein n=1 Tax=Phytophthora oleae TaxID=2107226 RepID=A0ABD3EUK0_9STRA
MWMQNSVGGGSGNFHDRNRFGSQYAQNSYSGGAPHDSAGDWKSKILESGQWLGGKVIEYGGKLARGPNTESIPDHYGQQMPRNDGRANWMADIRSSSSGGGSGSYNGGYNGSGGYQNDFATERPKAFSEYNRGYPPTNANPSGTVGYEPKSSSSADHHHHKTRRAKKKSDRKKSKKSRKKQQSESESDSEAQSEELSISESSGTESADERHYKSKSKNKKSKTKKHSGFYSESESDEGDTKKKASKDYSFSFDPAKLPPPPAEDEKGSSKRSKSKKSKKEKSSKKSRTRRQSIASTDDESTSEKESTRAKAKKRGSNKAAAATATTASVDLLGVDLDVQPAAQTATAGLPVQEMQPSIFDAPQNQNPLQDLAGLSFSAPVQTSAPTQPSVFDATPASNESQTPPQQQADTFRSSLLPENNIVDFTSLASEKKKSLSANPEEKRTLNDLQKARGGDQPAPMMAMPMQGQQPMQQNMSGNMMQLSMSMNQLQLTDGSAQMHPNMQMQQMPMQGMTQQMQPQMMMMQPQMGMMAQPQMMNMPMMQQQQFVQGGAVMAQSAGAQQTSQGMASGASNSNNSDPFSQVNMM